MSDNLKKLQALVSKMNPSEVQAFLKSMEAPVKPNKAPVRVIPKRASTRETAQKALDKVPEGETVQAFVDRCVKHYHVATSGKYHISLNMRVCVNRRNRTIVDKMISEDVELKAGNIKRKIVKIINDVYMNQYDNGYMPILIDIQNMIVKLRTNRTLNTVKLKQTSLAYKMLGDLTNVNKNPGQCVLDYILHETQNTPRFKTITRPALIKFFGENCQEEGISTQQIIDWAKHKQYVKVIALDPFLKVFEEFVPVMNSHTCLSLVFIVNNEHCYPILDQDMKRKISRAKQLDLPSIVYDIKFDEYGSWQGNADEMDALIAGTLHPHKKVILVDMNNLAELVNNVISKTSLMITRIKLYYANVSSFEHPVSKFISLLKT